MQRGASEGGRYKGIIFDMDNTILRSKIDFGAMKAKTFAHLVSRGFLPECLPLERHTTATIIEEAIATGKMTAACIQAMWDVVREVEVVGMQDAELEPGAAELLEGLAGRYVCAVVTNNAVEAARAALEHNRIISYFGCIVGREMMGKLKPSPDGYLHVLEAYPQIAAGQWISVGDAWIDGKGSADAGIPFVAYQGNREQMRSHGVVPLAEIDDIRMLRAWLEEEAGAAD